MSIEEKIIFGISWEGQGDGIPVVILGVPAGAWEYMRNGKSHSFDLTKLGAQIKIVMYGAKDHASAMKMISGNLAPDQKLDLRDFAIKPR